MTTTFEDRVRACVQKLNDPQIAAECLNPLRIGEGLFFERFGRNADTECIFREAVPYKVPIATAFYLGEHLTDEAFARAYKEFEDDHIYKVLTGYYEKEQKARDALRKISPNLPRKDWIRVGMALKHEFGESGWPMWQSWSAPGKTYDPSDIQYQWQTLPTGGPNPVTIGTILHLAKGEVTRG